MNLQAGQLNRKISLWRRDPARDAATGEDLGDWIPFTTDARPWAAVTSLGGLEASGVEVRAAATTKEFVVWWRADVTVQDRVIYEDRAYDIVALEEVGDREGLRIRATARAET